MTVKTATYKDFFTALCHAMKWPASTTNLYALAEVSIFEGPNDPAAPPARYNPLNCEGEFGSSRPWNSVGVQDYVNFGQGVAGTAHFLDGSHWANVRKVMADPKSTYSEVRAAWVSAYTWANLGKLSVTGAMLVKRLDRVIGVQPVTGTPTPPKPAPAGHSVEYTVHAGDSLWTIAERYYHHGEDWTRIAAANHLHVPYTIHAGNKLTIPQ